MHVRRTSSPLVLPAELQERCEGTVGDWCGRFFMQKPVPAKVRFHQPMPHGSGRIAAVLPFYAQGNTRGGHWPYICSGSNGKGDPACPRICIVAAVATKFTAILS